MKTVTTIIVISFLVILLMPVPVWAVPDRGAESIVTSPAVNIETVTQVIFGLILVIVMILIAGLVYRKTGRYGQNNIRDLGIVTGFSIGGKERIILIRAGNEQILVGVGPGVIQTIHVLETPLDHSRDTKERGRNFIEKLNKELKKISL